MNEHPDQPQGHPVISGFIAMAAWSLLRHYAAAYLVRTRGGQAAARYFRRADRKLAAAVIGFLAIGIAAAFISYSSLAAAEMILKLDALAAAVLIVPDAIRILCWTSRELGWRRVTYGPLAGRFFAEAQQRFPRIFP